MQRGKNRTNKTTLTSERRSALKKRLTEPALLEMSGNRVNQALRPSIGLFGDYVLSTAKPMLPRPHSGTGLLLHTFQILTALMQDHVRYLTLIVGDEFQLSVHHLQKELGR